MNRLNSKILYPSKHWNVYMYLVKLHLFGSRYWLVVGVCDLLSCNVGQWSWGDRLLHEQVEPIGLIRPASGVPGHCWGLDHPLRDRVSHICKEHCYLYPVHRRLVTWIQLWKSLTIRHKVPNFQGHKNTIITI